MSNTWKRAGAFAIALASILIALAGSALSSTFTIPSDDELIIGARAIVRGKVLSISSQLDPQQDRIFTYVTIRVREVLKGQIASRKIVLKEEGGQVGTRGSIVFGSPEFTVGEEVLVYLDTWRDGSLRVHQMLLGKFKVINDPGSGTKVVVRNLTERGDPRSVFKADALSRTNATDYSPLSAYTAMVRARLTVNWDRSEEFLQTHYREISILARPREYKTPSGDQLHANFNFYPQAQPARWFSPDALQPVVFFVNPDSAPYTQIVDDVTEAMNAWSNVPNCNLRIVNGGTTGVCYSGAQNTMLFNGCDGRFSPTPQCARILALGGLHWTSTSTRVINGVTFVEASGGFVSFNPYASCDFDDRCKVKEIATHELGHSLGLGHSEFPDATMFGVAHFDGRCASIRQDDMDAVAFVYPTENGPGTPLTITTTDLMFGVLGITYPPQNIVATGGSRPYSWEVAAGLGRLPQGMSLAGIGVLNGQPSETGVFNFTALVRDRAGTEVQKALSMTVVAVSGPYDSQFVSQALPTTVNTGQQFRVTMNWLNIGTQVWDPSAGFRVRSQNPANNTTWGGSTFIPTGGVPSGQQLNVTFTVTAPSVGGTYNFQWQLSQDGNLMFGQVSPNVSIVVTDPNPPSVSSPSSVAAVQGSPFTFQLSAAGGTTPFTWSVASGALPAGLGLNSTTGVVTGTPTAPGDFPVGFKVTDAQGRTAQKLITITVGPPVLTIITGAIPSVQKGVTFSHQLTAAGGKPPYRWALTGGALPAGLLLSGTTGVIAGTPSVVGSFSFTVDVTDADSHSSQKTLSITVTPPPLSLSAATSVDALKGLAFNYQPSATGGTPPYVWSVSAGALPTGLALNANSGAISGTPTQIGTSSFTLSVRDLPGATATAVIQLRVIDPETVPAITKVKYKSDKRQLIVNGDRVNPAATLVVDGPATNATPNGRQFKLKKLTLSPGQHEIRIVNPGDISSAPFVLNVK